MPGASYPKGDDERVNRTPPAFGWTDLPASGREGPPPALPDWIPWPPATVDWWAVLWAKPQATQWAQDGSTLWTLAMLHARLVLSAGNEATAAEMRQHEDRHGLTPKAMLQLRWRIVDAGGGGPKSKAAVKAATKKRSARKGAAMKVLEGGRGDPA